MSPLSPSTFSPLRDDSSDHYVRPSSRQHFRRPSATIIAMPDTDLGLGTPAPSESTGAILLSPLSSPSSGSPYLRSSGLFRPSHLSHDQNSGSDNDTLPGIHPCETENEEDMDEISRASSPGTGMGHPLARSRTLERMLSMESSASAPSELYQPVSNGSASEATPLLAENGPDTGRWYHGPVFVAGVKLSILFAGFSALVLGTFWFGMPTVDPEDRPAIKLPRNFADLQALNNLLHKYKDLYPYRICLCGVVAYLYVQAFSLPGSMYISILLGAAYGMIIGLVLSCLCDATGSILCYTLSALLGPPLLELPYYRKRVERWRKKIMGDAEKGQEVGWDSVFAILLTLRILPFPPHWLANFVAPHLGIGMGFFWIACFIGIIPVSVIHVTIGTSLDQMTSADDFHILSLRNILGLGAVIVAVLIPVGLKRVFKQDLGDLGEEEDVADTLPVDNLEGAEDIPPEPVAVEFDEHGLPKRYQAVDSGVVLAGPSDGDPAYDLVADSPRSRLLPIPVGRAKGKGKGKHKNAHTQELADDDAASISAFSTYELSSARPTSLRSTRSKRIKGYGTIDLEHEERTQASSRWWPFSTGR